MIFQKMMELTPEQLQVYRAHFRATQARYVRNQEVRHQVGWVRARAAAQILRVEFRVEAIYLFGSLLEPKAIHPGSDIDLATIGLASHQYYEALGTLLCQTKDFSVDLVCLEEAQSSLKQHILDCGVRL